MHILFVSSVLFPCSTTNLVQKLWLVNVSRAFEPAIRLNVVPHEAFMAMLNANNPSSTELWDTLAKSDLVLGGLSR